MADVFGEVLSDTAQTIAIISGITLGFRWLSKKLESWITREVHDEVKKAMHEELQNHEIRLQAVELWIGGFKAARVEIRPDRTDYEILS